MPLVSVFFVKDMKRGFRLNDILKYLNCRGLQMVQLIGRKIVPLLFLLISLLQQAIDDRCLVIAVTSLSSASHIHFVRSGNVFCVRACVSCCN